MSLTTYILVKDTFSFVQEITNYNNSNYIMASFDIVSLYTNIPIHETIDLILDLAFCNREMFSGFNKVQFKKLLEISLLDTYFIFNKKLYKQCDGLAMSQPVAPTLANIFLCIHEKKWLDECTLNFKPTLYRGYLDNTFLLFQEHRQIDVF